MAQYIYRLTVSLVQLKRTLIVYPPLAVHFNPALLEEHIASIVTVLASVMINSTTCGALVV